jgi:hypothetical protein
VKVTGRAHVPASGVGAVVLNVTATNTTAATYVTAWPTGAPLPTASSLNPGPGQTVAIQVFARVGVGGQVSFFNFAGSVDLAVDVVGWFPIDYGATLPSETHRGSGSAVFNIRWPASQPAILTYSEASPDEFELTGFDATNHQTDLSVLNFGPAAGTVGLNFSFGPGTTKIQIQSQGSWSVTIRPLARAPAFNRSVSGAGEGVVIYVGRATRIGITNNPPQPSFEGLDVTGYFNDGDFDIVISRSHGSGTSFGVVPDGPVVLTVEATGAWSIRGG